MAEQIEAEVTEPGVRDVNVPAIERMDLWRVAPTATAWQYCGTWATPIALANAAAAYQREGHYVRIVHYTLPALTIQAKENPNGKGD